MDTIAVVDKGRFTAGLRRGVGTVARRLGKEDQIRALRRATLPQREQRNRRDDEALVLLMAAVLNRSSDCIDVGAHRGSILSEMIRLAPEGRHIAFEPHPEVSRDLAQAFPMVEVRSEALSNRSGGGWFYVRGDDPAASWLSHAPTGEDRDRPPDPEGARAVAMTLARLDDVLPDEHAPRLIKIDVEGAEYEVLEGARETLHRHRPVVAFEHSLGCRNYGREPGEVHELLNAAGYRILDMDGGGPYDHTAFRSEVLSLRRWFFFAVPSV